MEHMEKFQKAIINSCEIVTDLGKLRDILDDAIENAKQERNVDFSFYN